LENIQNQIVQKQFAKFNSFLKSSLKVGILYSFFIKYYQKCLNT